jgi:hypothetical protein
LLFGNANHDNGAEVPKVSGTQICAHNEAPLDEGYGVTRIRLGEVGENG